MYDKGVLNDASTGGSLWRAEAMLPFASWNVPLRRCASPTSKNNCVANTARLRIPTSTAIPPFLARGRALRHMMLAAPPTLELPSPCMRNPGRNGFGRVCAESGTISAFGTGWTLVLMSWHRPLL